MSIICVVGLCLRVLIVQFAGIDEDDAPESQEKDDEEMPPLEGEGEDDQSRMEEVD